VGFDVWTCWRE